MANVEGGDDRIEEITDADLNTFRTAQATADIPATPESQIRTSADLTTKLRVGMTLADARADAKVDPDKIVAETMAQMGIPPIEVPDQSSAAKKDEGKKPDQPAIFKLTDQGVQIISGDKETATSKIWRKLNK